MHPIHHEYRYIFAQLQTISIHDTPVNETYLTYLKLTLGVSCVADLVDPEEYDKYKTAYSSFQ